MLEPGELLSTMDAKVWADEFMETKARLGEKEFDHAMMLGWFANAIMAGFDEATRRAQRALDAEREKVKELERDNAAMKQLFHANPSALWGQLATLQAQLAAAKKVKADYDRWLSGGVYFTTAEYEKHVAGHKQQVQALQAQLRQVEGDRQTLRQLVEVHTKQLTELTIIPIGCSREQELRWTQSIKDLRAALAAQDAPHPTEERS